MPGNVSGSDGRLSDPDGVQHDDPADPIGSATKALLDAVFQNHKQAQHELQACCCDCGSCELHSRGPVGPSRPAWAPQPAARFEPAHFTRRTFMVTMSMAHKKSGRAPALADDIVAAASVKLPPKIASSKASAKPLRVKVPKSKERALIREFGLDATTLTEEESEKRRNELTTLIKMGKSRGFLTQQEINDHLPGVSCSRSSLQASRVG